MEDQNNQPERKPGPIQKMFDWTLALIAVATMIGLAWRYVLQPLFLGGGL